MLSFLVFSFLLVFIDDRQITHLICVHLKHLLCDCFGGVLGLLPVRVLFILGCVLGFVQSSLVP